MVKKLYLTPPDIPEGLTCRTLKMPDSLYWLGIFNNALLTTTGAWNWEQVNDTDMTIDEAVAKCQLILNDFWSSSLCDVCPLPSGEPTMRIGAGGEIEWLTPSGWETPTGDYAPPTIPARTDGTPDDQRCLAAANAARCLELLYENLNDSYGEGLDNGEALTAFLVAVATIIAAAVALWVAAIVALVGILFGLVYDTMQYLTTDLWTSEFTEALTCILYQCSTNTGGVVTFDYDCILNNLAAQTDVTSSLTFDQLRLFGQVVYILQFISVDGLNSAGATTSVTDYDCTNCECNLGETVTFDNADCYTLMNRINFAATTLDVTQGNPAPCAKSGNRLTGTGHAVKVRVNVGARISQASMQINWNSASNPSNVYLREITMYSASNTILAQFSSAAGGFTQNTWHTVTVNYAGATVCAYIICEGAVEGTGQSGRGLIDNISMTLV